MLPLSELNYSGTGWHFSFGETCSSFYTHFCRLRVNNSAGITLQTECIHNSGISCSACICVCFLHQSQRMCSSLISTSKVTLAFHARFSSRDRVAGIEQRVGVMGNDRTGRGKYQSKAHCSWGLRSCCSEAPRLLGFCQLIKAKSLPIPAGIRIKRPREPFIPNWMPPVVTAEARQQAAHGWQSLTWRSGSQYPAEVAQLRHERGKRWKGHQENGILKDTACLRQEHTKQEAIWCQAGS